MVTKEIVWMCHKNSCLAHPQIHPTSLLCDNQSCIHLGYNLEFSRCTKHIDILFHIIYEKKIACEINMSYVSSIH